MKCPVCDNVRMREVQKDDVLIDVCPDCKGVWLDRGELDKLMKGVHEMQQELDELEHEAPASQIGSGGNTPQPAGGSVPVFGNGSQPQQPPLQGGYNQPPPQQYGTPSQGQYGGQQGQYGHDNRSYDKHGKYGYDKHGYPYKKKKKTVLDVFGDLFD